MPVCTAEFEKYRYVIDSRKSTFNKANAVVKKMTIIQDISPVNGVNPSNELNGQRAQRGHSQELDKESRACRALSAFDATKTNTRLDGFPSLSLRMDNTFGSSRWVVFNKDVGSEMTSGTWIVSKDMEIVGGPLSSAMGLVRGDVSDERSHLNYSHEKLGDVEKWLESNVDVQTDEIDEPPENATDFRPDFNSTFELISYEDDDELPGLDSGSVIVTGPMSSYFCLPTKCIEDWKSQEQDATEPFQLSEMVEELTRILKQPKNQQPPHSCPNSSMYQISKKAVELERYICGCKESKCSDSMGKVDSGFGDSLSISNRDVENANTAGYTTLSCTDEITKLNLNGSNTSEHIEAPLLESISCPIDNVIKPLKRSRSRGSASVVIFPNA